MKEEENLIIKRTLGGLDSREQIGGGIMHKRGAEDIFDRTFRIYSLSYVVRGRGIYRDGRGNTWEMGPGTVFQRFPGVSHATSLDPESRWMEYYIDLGPELGRALMTSRLIREDIPVLNRSGDTRLKKRFCDFIDALSRCGEEEIGRMVPEALILINHLFSSAGGEGESRSEREMVGEARDYFVENLHRRINLETFCAARGWGYERFRKVFKQHTALSPGQFILQRRIDRASEWLLGTELSIKEIGSRLGYPTPYEFSHQFKRITGVSPREYRRRQS